MPTSAPLLALDHLEVRFDQHHIDHAVVKGISLEIAAGEKFALVGESGSGKTVTALSILRLNPDVSYRGAIRFAGENILQYNDRQLRGLRGNRVAMIFQEPMTALNALYSIGNQISEVLTLHQGLSAKAAWARAIALLDRVGIPEPARRATALPHQLSGGQRQRAMIAMALACQPQLLIADEPTTALDVTLQVQILELLNELQRETGMAILLISHDLNLVRRFADRVGVMQQGELVEVASSAELFRAPQHPYSQRLLASRPQPLAQPLADNASEALAVRRFSCRYPLKGGWFRHDWFTAVQPLDFSVRRGETLGIVGESGSGKTTLGLSLLRLSGIGEGEINLAGQRIDTLSQRQLRPLRRSMQVVFQDPYSSLSPRMTVEEILDEGLSLHFPLLTQDERRQRIVATLADVGLGQEILSRYPHEFSGGQRQRLAIARAVILQPDVLLLDEPTSALDVSIQQQVLQLLARLQQKYGLAYLFISHDLAVIRAMAHRVMVLKDGVVVEAGATHEVLAAPNHPYTRQLLAAADLVEVARRPASNAVQLQ